LILNLIHKDHETVLVTVAQAFAKAMTCLTLLEQSMVCSGWLIQEQRA